MIPARYQKAKYEEVPEKIKNLFEAMKTSRKGIYLHGAVGTGKTHLVFGLYSAAGEVLGVKTMFRNTSELLRSIRLDFDRNGSDKERAEEAVMDFKGLLFLDDLGAEKMTEWVAETFYLIVNRRYNEMLPTVITSNLPVAELAERIGDRTVSRIVEMCDVVEISGKDDRRIKNQIKITI
jgi:DNA replication protein DnaC